MHRRIGRYRRSEHRKSLTSLKLVAGTPLWQPTSLTLTLNAIFCTTNVLFATGNEHTTNDVPCLRLSVVSYFLSADSGRYADTLTGHTGNLRLSTSNCCVAVCRSGLGENPGQRRAREQDRRWAGEGSGQWVGAQLGLSDPAAAHRRPLSYTHAHRRTSPYSCFFFFPGMHH